MGVRWGAGAQLRRMWWGLRPHLIHGYCKGLATYLTRGNRKLCLVSQIKPMKKIYLLPLFSCHLPPFSFAVHSYLELELAATG